MPDEPSPPEASNASMRADLEAALGRIAEIVQDIDADYAFNVIVGWALLEGCADRPNHQGVPVHLIVELAAFHLYPYFGKGGDRDYDRVWKLVHHLQSAVAGAFGGAFEDTSGDADGLGIVRGRVRSHARMVRGEAYAAQTRRRIQGAFGRFQAKLDQKIGISPDRALAILQAILELLEDRVDALLKSHLPRGAEPSQEATDALYHALGKGLAPSYEEIDRKIERLTRSEWEALRNLVGLTPEVRANLIEAPELAQRPLFFLPKDRVLFLELNQVYDAVWEALDGFASRDPSLRDAYAKRRAQWMEEEAAHCFELLFPSSAIYRNLTYPDPDKRGGTAELDLAVSWGPFLLLVEAKGSQFRPESRQGDPVALTQDLRRNIEKAFDQAERARRYIQSVLETAFREIKTSRKLKVKTNAVRMIFPISVTLRHLSGVATQLAELQSAGLFKGGVYPWSVSLADLEVVCRFAEYPEAFMLYVSRRIQMQQTGRHFHGDELDLFGHFLENRLHPDHTLNRKTADGETPDVIHFAGGTEPFDRWYHAHLTGQPLPVVNLGLPTFVVKLLGELRAKNDDMGKWVSYLLLFFAPEFLAALAHHFERLRTEAAGKDALVSATLHDKRFVVSYLAGRNRTRADLRPRAAFVGMLEKYRYQTRYSLVFAGDPASETLMEALVLIDAPWVADPRWEKEVRLHPASKQAMKPGESE